jgi:hypothetical protein
MGALWFRASKKRKNDLPSSTYEHIVVTNAYHIPIGMYNYGFYNKRFLMGVRMMLLWPASGTIYYPSMV